MASPRGWCRGPCTSSTRRRTLFAEWLAKEGACKGKQKRRCENKDGMQKRHGTMPLAHAASISHLCLSQLICTAAASCIRRSVQHQHVSKLDLGGHNKAARRAGG